ncbi:MAG TPA: hypothetical protein VF897_16615 [Roseiflexaceae bacterium]
MIDHASRYYILEDAVYEAPDGQRIAYKRRRFLPRGETLPQLSEYAVGLGDRLDLIANQSLGDPLQFWQICDANDCMNPFDLTREPGRRLRVPLPQFEESR